MQILTPYLDKHTTLVKIKSSNYKKYLDSPGSPSLFYIEFDKS